MTGLPAFQELVSRLDYPMAVVTAAADGERSGCLVGFHTQCSIDPARYLVCLSEKNHTFAVAARSTHLAVHVLDREDRELAELFGGRTGDEIDKFAGCSWREELGVPVLTRPKAWFVGRVLDRVTLGDHTGHLLEPVTADVTGRLHQLSFQQVTALSAGHSA